MADPTPDPLAEALWTALADSAYRVEVTTDFGRGTGPTTGTPGRMFDQASCREVAARLRDAGVEMGLDVERAARAFVWETLGHDDPTAFRPDGRPYEGDMQWAERFVREYAAAREKP